MGAAFCYRPEERALWEAVDLRAFGILLGELLDRVEGADPMLIQEIREI